MTNEGFLQQTMTVNLYITKHISVVFIIPRIALEKCYLMKALTQENLEAHFLFLDHVLKHRDPISKENKQTNKKQKPMLPSPE